MKNTRLLILAAAFLALFISACSQPSEVAAPTLEPQFGTRGNDSVEDVAYSKAGYLYAVGTLDDEEDTRQLGYQCPRKSEAYLRRYDRSGNLIWENYFDLETSDEFYSANHQLAAQAVTVDASGNALVAWSADYFEYYAPGFCYKVVASFNYLSKYAPNGTKLWRAYTGSNRISDLALDSSGNAYAISNAHDPYCRSGCALIKYGSSGIKLWEKLVYQGPTDEPAGPTGVAVSSNHDVYIVRRDGALVKYGSGGKMLWSNTTSLQGSRYNSYAFYKIAVGLNGELFVVGSYLYNEDISEACDDSATDYYFYARLFKLDKNGTRQWYRNTAKMQTYDDGGCAGEYGWFPQYGLNLTTDSLGNAYTVGGTDNRDAFATKHNRSGTRLWSRTFGTGRTDGATSVATYDGTEVFVGGVTYGYLVHRNIGGSDAFLREMDKSGNRVWTR